LIQGNSGAEIYSVVIWNTARLTHSVAMYSNYSQMVETK